MRGASLSACHLALCPEPTPCSCSLVTVSGFLGYCVYFPTCPPLKPLNLTPVSNLSCSVTHPQPGTLDLMLCSTPRCTRCRRGAPRPQSSRAARSSSSTSPPTPSAQVLSRSLIIANLYLHTFFVRYTCIHVCACSLYTPTDIGLLVEWSIPAHRVCAKPWPVAPTYNAQAARATLTVTSCASSTAASRRRAPRRTTTWCLARGGVLGRRLLLCRMCAAFG